MTVKDLETLFDYGYWANGKLFEAMSGLTPEQFTQPMAGSDGSIRNTMVHMLSAEWGWIARCGGPERGPALDPADFPTVTSLVPTWERVEASVRGSCPRFVTRTSPVPSNSRLAGWRSSPCRRENCCSTRPITAFITADRSRYG